jgi:hypothetical protein
MAVGFRKRFVVPIGGLTDIGFDKGETHLLLVSHQGRGVVRISDCVTCARDLEVLLLDSPWHNADGPLFLGIGPLAGEWIPTSGLAGGLLPQNNQDGWHCRYDQDRILLFAPGSNVPVLSVEPLTEPKAIGFSLSGRYFVIAESADITVFEFTETTEPSAQ